MALKGLKAIFDFFYYGLQNWVVFIITYLYWIEPIIWLNSSAVLPFSCNYWNTTYLIHYKTNKYG